MIVTDSNKSIIKSNAILNGMKRAVVVYQCTDDCTDFIIMDINEIAESVENVKRNEIIGRTITDVFPGVQEFGIFSVIKRVWRTGSPEHIDTKEYKDSRIIGWRENDIIKLDSGEVVAIYDNRSAQKKAETALTESEKRYSSIILTSIDGYFMLHNNGNIIDVNVSFASMIGYNRDELLGKTVFDIFLPESIADYQTLIGKIKELNDSYFETSFICKNGNSVDVEISANNSEDWESIFCFVRDITERKQKEAELLYVGYHDKLTGLFNRVFFEEEVKRLDVPREYPLSFIIADINGLKFANDAFGHEYGDNVLIRLADILRLSFRKEDIIARWGGDEFVILLPKTSIDVAQEMCERIREMTTGITIGPMKLSVSYGYATKTNVEQQFDSIIKDAENQMYQYKLLNVHSGRSETVTSLIKTMNEMNYETEEHEQRLLNIVTQIGHNLNLMSQEIEELKLLAILHDLGKLGISKEIIMKPSSLTPEEWVEIKKHSEIGYRISEAIPGLTHISKYILSVHERWDGKGYPQGLAGNEIPKLSRIIAIVDAYDAMISGRPYKKPIVHQEAINEIVRCSGTQFDPVLVELFLKISLDEGKTIGYGKTQEINGFCPR